MHKRSYAPPPSSSWFSFLWENALDDVWLHTGYTPALPTPQLNFPPMPGVLMVVGGAGFVGSAIVQWGVETPWIEKVVAVDINRSRLAELGWLWRHEVQCELLEKGDSEEVNYLLHCHQPHYLVVAAGNTNSGELQVDTARGYLENAYYLKPWIECSARCTTTGLLLSTFETVKPCNVLGRSKRLAEALALVGYENKAWSVLQFGLVIGTPRTIFQFFLEQLMLGQKNTVTSPTVSKHICHRKQVAQAVSIALTRCPGERMLLNTGNAVPVVDIATLTAQLLGQLPSITFTELRAWDRELEPTVLSSQETVVRSVETNFLMEQALIACTAHSAELDEAIAAELEQSDWGT
jgi:FlaA1/EpsC-like NDP-sugar epimerase